MSRRDEPTRSPADHADHADHADEAAGTAPGPARVTADRGAGAARAPAAHEPAPERRAADKPARREQGPKPRDPAAPGSAAPGSAAPGSAAPAPGAPAGERSGAAEAPAGPGPDRLELDLAPPAGRVIPEPVRSTGPITRGAIADAAKLAVLARIRAALADVPTAERPHHVRVTRAYRTSGDSQRDDLVELLVDRLLDYGAAVHRVPAERLPRVILDACRARGVKRLVVPADLPAEWRPGYAEVLVDEPRAPLDLASIDAADGVVTACALAIAETGTIVIDGGDWQGRRAITLVPDYHLCVVHADQVVGTVPEAVAALAGAANRPLTLISGPSATSDIELRRVQGVHGPRTLEVLLIC